MAPKPKAAPKAAAASTIPVVEDEVELPEGMDPVPDPPFSWAMIHVASHTFGVVTGADAPAEGEPAPIREFDPLAVLVGQVKKEAEEGQTQTLVVVEREDLESFSEGGTLASGLRRKAEAEAASRQRQKVNAARNRAIAAADSGSQPEAQNDEPENDSLDFTLLLAGYPATAEEAQELQDEGLFDLADAWVSVHLAGESLFDEPSEDAPPIRKIQSLGAPAVVHTLRDLFLSADQGSAMANSTVVELHDCHAWAHAADAGETGESGELEAQQIRTALLDCIGSAAGQRLRYRSWMESLPIERVALPADRHRSSDGEAGEDGGDDPKQPLDTYLYERLAGAVDPAHHDIPFLLFCLCEQVALSLRGNSNGSASRSAAAQAVLMEDEEAAAEQLGIKDRFLGGAGDLFMFGDALPKYDKAKEAAVGSLIEMVEKEEQDEIEEHENELVPGMAPPPALGVEPDPELGDDLVVPYQDQASVIHCGDTLPGGNPVIAEIEQILSYLRAPGIRRCSFPPGDAPMNAAARSAHRNRLYTFLPHLSVVEVERLMVLTEFENLMNRVQPERTWNFKDRVHHEKIPGTYLSQTLLSAGRDEYFIDTCYMARQDCLLIAMHHRALPGRVLWHSWEGDLLRLVPRDDGPAVSGNVKRMCPVPSFNDWWQLISGKPSQIPPHLAKLIVGSKQPSRSGSEASRNPTKSSEQQDLFKAETAENDVLPQSPAKVIALDAREVGYCKMVEKILVPNDGSVIFRTVSQRGVQDAILPLTVDSEATAIPSPPERKAAEEKVEDDLDSESEEEEIDPRLKEYAPGPRKQMRSVRVVKDGITFGIVSDPAWHTKLEQMRLEREEMERAEAQALAEKAAAENENREAPEPGEADEEGAGEEPAEAAEEEPQPSEDEENQNITERFIHESKFGKFWVAFHDGARCTARVEVDKPWFLPGDISWDSASCRPGVQVNYTCVSGLVIQAYSSGAVRQSWPLQRLVSSTTIPSKGSGNESALPGEVEDLEMARTITAFGVLVSERLSGRKEVSHPNGTRCWRNPTIEELKTRRDSMKLASKMKGCDVFYRSLVDRIEQICAAWEERQADENPADPSEALKYIGVPGHWRVTTIDGRRFGRACNDLPPPLAPVEPAPSSQGEAAPTGSQVPSKQASAEPTPRDAEEGEEDDEEDVDDEESEPEAPEAPPTLQDIFEAVPVDEGENIEYTLDPVPMYSQRDPHTGTCSISNEEGMLFLTMPDGKSNVCILPDGTRVMQNQMAEGTELVIEKDRFASVTCKVQDKAYSPNTFVSVVCDDGSCFEIIPRTLNLKGELVPSNPASFIKALKEQSSKDEPLSPSKTLKGLDVTSPSGASQHAEMGGTVLDMKKSNDPRVNDFSTNASVLLRRPDGMLVNSKGDGDVEIISNFDVAALGEEKALKTSQDRGGVYVAQVDWDRAKIRDDDGNYFELRGDQTVDFKLSVSMGDDFASPRCTVPNKPFHHPDISFLPLPEEAPTPRLFVVYGDGEAEELISSKNVEELLRLARQDPNSLVIEGEQLGWPMNRCKAHTIHRILPMDPVRLPMTPVHLPPSVAGFGLGDTPGNQRTFTEFRQFIEYPMISEETSLSWARALVDYAEEEKRCKAVQDSLGKGLRGTFGDGYVVENMDAAEGGA
eukprot:TRINITY_DN28926_c0_g2_i1.p1 TRINITY_DN28926_c0_g2~~TRINITY_DN28926_c0_g2_i1.p1  ORF type:complete len:1643 (+),score=351.39 TRINITY_DN28926_c0_g2_i1:129-5057(+)